MLTNTNKIQVQTNTNFKSEIPEKIQWQKVLNKQGKNRGILKNTNIIANKVRNTNTNSTTERAEKIQRSKGQNTGNRAKTEEY